MLTTYAYRAPKRVPSYAFGYENNIQMHSNHEDSLGVGIPFSMLLPYWFPIPTNNYICMVKNIGTINNKCSIHLMVIHSP